MRRLCFALGALFAAAALTRAQDEPQKKPPAKKASAAESDQQSVADQIQAIDTEMSQRQSDIIKRYRAAEQDEERQKLLEEYKKLQSEKIDKYVEIAEKHPGDEQIVTICQQLVAQGAPAEKLFRVLIKKGKSHDIKGLATFGLGKALAEQANGKDLDEAQRSSLRKEAQKTLRTVAKSYADVDVGGSTAGELIGGILYELEHLSIGMRVPDLKGDDLEGAKFKLSDYRGKVVFLDFWAHW